MSAASAGRASHRRRCTVCGKVCFATWEAALNVIAMASSRRREASAYYASGCGWWHLTSQTAARKAVPRNLTRGAA